MVLLSKPVAPRTSGGPSRQISPEVLQVFHFGQPALMEKHLITVAKVRTAKGERLHECVIVHPRYAKGHLKPSDYDIVMVLGYREGRSIDILLDVPFEHEGRKYGILNFKGAGARALDEDPYGFIHPTKWYRGSWIPMEMADTGFLRCFGAVRRGDAYNEFRDRLLPSLGIPQVPHVSANPFPNDLNRAIYRVANEPQRHRFSQLVRACSTNIRMRDRYDMSLAALDEDSLQRFAISLAGIDALVLKAQMRLVRNGRMLELVGEVSENRFYTGEFTDAENYTTNPLIYNSDSWYTAERPTAFVSDAMLGSIDLLRHPSPDLAVRLRMNEVYRSILSGVFGESFGEDLARSGAHHAVNAVLAGVLTEPI